MDEQNTQTSHARRPSGRDAKRAARAARAGASIPYITRKIPYYEVLSEEGLALMEHNADIILEEIGIDFRDDPEALEIWKAAGADVKGERVHFARGMCRSLIQRTAPREFTQHARNPARSVVIGGKNTVFAPAYGSPFVRSLDEGRRYARIEDFRNFVKLAYLANSLHHSGGTICEPVDLPVNKRHLDMVYSHLKYSDKAFMGSVTAPERAADSVAMANIVFGEELNDPLTGRPKTTIINLINVNSPMTYDATMLGAAKVYARANQALIITPFILAGAMSPVTVAGTVAQTFAEALAGLAFVQLVNPVLPRPFRCNRAPRRSEHRSRHWCCTPWPLSPGVSGYRFAPAAACAHRRFRMRKRPTSRRTPCCRPVSRASISCCTRPGGSRADWPWAMKNSSWMRTRPA